MDVADMKLEQALRLDSLKPEKSTPIQIEGSVLHELMASYQETNEDDERHIRENMIQELKDELVKQRYTNDLVHLFGSKVITRDTRMTDMNVMDPVFEDHYVEDDEVYFDDLNRDDQKEPIRRNKTDFSAFEMDDVDGHLLETSPISITDKDAHDEVIEKLKKDAELRKSAVPTQTNQKKGVALSARKNDPFRREIANDMNKSSDVSLDIDSHPDLNDSLFDKDHIGHMSINLSEENEDDIDIEPKNILNDFSDEEKKIKDDKIHLQYVPTLGTPILKGKEELSPDENVIQISAQVKFNQKQKYNVIEFQEKSNNEKNQTKMDYPVFDSAESLSMNKAKEIAKSKLPDIDQMGYLKPIIEEHLQSEENSDYESNSVHKNIQLVLPIHDPTSSRHETVTINIDLNDLVNNNITDEIQVVDKYLINNNVPPKSDKQNEMDEPSELKNLNIIKENLNSETRNKMLVKNRDSQDIQLNDENEQHFNRSVANSDIETYETGKSNLRQDSGVNSYTNKIYFKAKARKSDDLYADPIRKELADMIFIDYTNAAVKERLEIDLLTDLTTKIGKSEVVIFDKNTNKTANERVLNEETGINKRAISSSTSESKEKMNIINDDVLLDDDSQHGLKMRYKSNAHLNLEEKVDYSHFVKNDHEKQNNSIEKIPDRTKTNYKSTEDVLNEKHLDQEQYYIEKDKMDEELIFNIAKKIPSYSLEEKGRSIKPIEKIEEMIKGEIKELDTNTDNYDNKKIDSAEKRYDDDKIHQLREEMAELKWREYSDSAIYDIIRENNLLTQDLKSENLQEKNNKNVAILDEEQLDRRKIGTSNKNTKSIDDKTAISVDVEDISKKLGKDSNTNLKNEPKKTSIKEQILDNKFDAPHKELELQGQTYNQHNVDQSCDETNTHFPVSNVTENASPIVPNSKPSLDNNLKVNEIKPPVTEDYFIDQVIRYKLSLIDKMNAVLNNRKLAKRIEIYEQFEKEMKGMVSVEFLEFVYHLNNDQTNGVYKIQKLWRKAIHRSILKKLIFATNDFRRRNRLTSVSVFANSKISLQKNMKQTKAK